MGRRGGAGGPTIAGSQGRGDGAGGATPAANEGQSAGHDADLVVQKRTSLDKQLNLLTQARHREAIESLDGRARLA